jgi:hypothetical protein
MNIKIGDEVLSRFGSSKIERITLTAGPGVNSGDEVPTVGIESLFAGKVVLDLENGHWIWSNQVLAINNVSIKRLREVA